jgi:aspartyl-tRNA(Asn)/glutamyl-tRNA(Gln) amidotransferase subunit A
MHPSSTCQSDSLGSWLRAAQQDARTRGLPEVASLLETLADSTRALRAATWNVAADEPPPDALEASPPVAAGEATAGPRRALEDMPGRTAAVDSETPIELQTIVDLAPRLASGELLARDLVEACLTRVARDNPTLNAMVTVLADAARAAALRADAARAAGHLHGPLHGIPITLKDLIDLQDCPTTASSNVRRHVVAPRDARVTRRLRDAGAIVLGKTNLHEFAFGTTTEDSAFGPTRHPVDPARSPGGSSGGSATAVRAGMGIASIGTDTGGSIRIPAAACGLVGLKPTFGEVPTDGVVPLAWSFDHVGPLARSVDDARLLWEVISGRPVTDGTTRVPPDPATLRLVLLEPYFCDILEDGVRHAFFAAIARLADAGVHVTPGALPHAGVVAPVYLHIVLAEAAAYHGPTLDRRAGDYTPPVRARLEMGRYVLGEDYARASLGREVLTREVETLLRGADALVLPTLPVTMPGLGESRVTVAGRTEGVRNITLRLTQLFDVTGHPAISLPIGDAAPGLPAGLQLVGRRDETAGLLAVARACETVLTRGK